MSLSRGWFCIRWLAIAGSLCGRPFSALADEPLESQLREIRETWLSIAKPVDSCSCESSMRLSRGEGTEPLKIDTETRSKLVFTKAGTLAEFRTHRTEGGKRMFDGRTLHLANEHYSCTLQDKAGDDRFIIAAPPKYSRKIGRMMELAAKSSGAVFVGFCLPTRSISSI